MPAADMTSASATVELAAIERGHARGAFGAGLGRVAPVAAGITGMPVIIGDVEPIGVVERDAVLLAAFAVIPGNEADGVAEIRTPRRQRPVSLW